MPDSAIPLDSIKQGKRIAILFRCPELAHQLNAYERFHESAPIWMVGYSDAINNLFS